MSRISGLLMFFSIKLQSISYLSPTILLEFMPFLALLKLGRTYIMEEKIAKEIFTEEIFVELMLRFTTSIAKIYFAKFFKTSQSQKFLSQKYSKVVNLKN